VPTQHVTKFAILLVLRDEARFWRKKGSKIRFFSGSKIEYLLHYKHFTFSENIHNYKGIL
jgi:hypothetical protein